MSDAVNSILTLKANPDNWHGTPEEWAAMREAVASTRADLVAANKGWSPNGNKWAVRYPNGDRVANELDVVFQANARKIVLNLMDLLEAKTAFTELLDRKIQEGEQKIRDMSKVIADSATIIASQAQEMEEQAQQAQQAQEEIESAYDKGVQWALSNAKVEIDALKEALASTIVEPKPRTGVLRAIADSASIEEEPSATVKPVKRKASPLATATLIAAVASLPPVE